MLTLLLLSWGLSGVALIGLDERAVYERLGAPVAVLHPGLHLILPWPLGRLRRVEFGPVHEIALDAAASGPTARPIGAEEPPPPSEDRLWEAVHAGEVSFLIASAASLAGAQQNFQIVSADIRLLYRIGLADDDALDAAYRVSDPAGLLRATAGRVIARFFAHATLAAVLGADREAMAEALRGEVRRALADAGSGIDLAGLVIEAIHPPPGAAAAYHAVQAAEINAAASIAAERGRAAASRSGARQYATTLVTQAAAGAAETAGTAQAALTRFLADRDAAAVGGRSFVLERYFAALLAGPAKSALTIVDHRIPAGEAPVFDLRPGAPSLAIPGAAAPSQE
jgi:regulator of protease activity HflC (stomatin/prohibitin superfamily)